MATPTTKQPAWGRGKLVALLAAAICTVLLLAAGLVLAVIYTLDPSHRESGKVATPSVASTRAMSFSALINEQSRRDALAEAPMPTVDLAASRPAPVSTRSPGTIQIPRPSRLGPNGVPTGFPHTPEGALAQLAAIDQTAMQSANLPGVRAVIENWATPGGPTPESWSAVSAMAEFFDAAGLSGGGAQQLALVVTPLMGLIKGQVGPDFVIPCVDFEFDATLTATSRVASADCQRMVWQVDRWMIGPGSEPAPAPSVWADTDAAIAAGYKDLRHD